MSDLGNRLRSSSSVSVRSDVGALQEKDFKAVEGWLNGFDKYNQLITTQVSKDPSYPQEDFAKICKALTKQCGGGFVHALPEALFDLALLWCPAERMVRKPVGTTEPSWSWTGWTGAVNFPFDPINCRETRRLPGDFFKSEITNFHIGPQKQPYTIRREKKEKLRIQFPPYFHAPFGSDSTTDSQTLRFTTQAISAEKFGVVQEHLDKDEIPISDLNDPSGLHCGLMMDYQTDLEYPLEIKSHFDFVLLSRNRRAEPSESARRPSVPTVHPPGTPIWHDGRFLHEKSQEEFDPNQFKDGEWKLLNVMLIQWMDDEHTYAERVAVGRIHEDAWKAASPVRKDIILQ
jgi:hypothetical protein